MKNPLLIIAGLLTAAAGNSYASGDGTKILKNTNSLKACIQYARQEMNKWTAGGELDRFERELRMG